MIDDQSTDSDVVFSSKKYPADWLYQTIDLLKHPVLHPSFGSASSDAEHLAVAVRATLRTFQRRGGGSSLSVCGGPSESWTMGDPQRPVQTPRGCSHPWVDLVDGACTDVRRLDAGYRRSRGRACAGCPYVRRPDTAGEEHTIPLFVRCFHKCHIYDSKDVLTTKLVVCRWHQSSS